MNNLTTMLNDFNNESYLEEYLKVFEVLSPSLIRNENTYNKFLSNCELYSIHNKEPVFEISLDFFVQYNVKFALFPTFIHFYDYRKYSLEVSETIYMNGVSLEDLKEYAYIYAVTKNKIRGITKKEILRIENNALYGVSYNYNMRKIFKDVLLEHKFEMPDSITMTSIKMGVEKRVDYIYNVKTQYLEEPDDDLYILEYVGNKIIVKNSELIG